jgi:hypothetical protein
LQFDRTADALYFIHSPRGNRVQGCLAPFLGFWLIGWSVACLALLVVVLQEQQLFLLAFAVPFWAAWFVVAALLAKTLFQRDEFLLTAGGAALRRRVFVPIHERYVPLEEIKEFRTYRATGDEDAEPSAGIEMLTLGTPMKLGEALPDDERLWLCDQLNEHLAEMRRQTPTDVSAARSAAATVQLPADSTWRYVDEGIAAVFHQRGRFSAAGVGGLLFLNLFWNGIVSVFVMLLWGLGPAGDQPQGMEWWFLFFFLIPFELIGFAMLIALLMTVLEPIRRTVWRITPDEAVCRIHWLGLGKTWNYPLADLQTVIAEPETSKFKFQSAKVQSENSSPPEHVSFRVALVNSKQEEICEINGLTEGEARFFASVIEARVQ